jgi:hypothetical protein
MQDPSDFKTQAGQIVSRLECVVAMNFTARYPEARLAYFAARRLEQDAEDRYCEANIECDDHLTAHR